MKHILLILSTSAILLSHSGKGQLKEFSQSQYHFLFTFQNDSFLILDDSVYCVSREKDGFPQVNNFIMREYKFVANDSVGYLKNASSGVVYSFDGNEFKRLDNSFQFQSQFKSFSFIHEKNLMDFGGYGLHTFKNIITYFNLNKKETDLYRIKTPLSSIPQPRDRMLGQYSNGEIFIGAGYGYPYEIINPFDTIVLINDFWKFSFKTNEWVKLGDGNFTLPYPYSPLYYFNSNTLAVSGKGVYEFDIQNNILMKYPQADVDVLNTLNFTMYQYDITYNNALDGFFMVINKQDRKAGVIFVKREDFLGPERIVSEIYEKDEKSILVIFGIIMGITALLSFKFIFYVRKKKKLSQIILSLEKELEPELKNEDFKVLMKIALAQNEFVNYTDLMDAFPDYLGYESKKKKLRLTLITLEEYLTNKFKLKPPIFDIRKNIEDKREKQIRLY